MSSWKPTKFIDTESVFGYVFNLTLAVESETKQFCACLPGLAACPVSYKTKQAKVTHSWTHQDKQLISFIDQLCITRVVIFHYAYNWSPNPVLENHAKS